MCGKPSCQDRTSRSFYSATIRLYTPLPNHHRPPLVNLATQPPRAHNSPPAPDRACLAPGLVVLRRTIQHALRSPNRPTDAFEPQRRSDTPLVFFFTGQHLPRTAGTYTALHRSTLACTSAKHVERSSNLVFALTMISCLYSPRYRTPEAFVQCLFTVCATAGVCMQVQCSAATQPVSSCATRAWMSSQHAYFVRLLHSTCSSLLHNVWGSGNHPTWLPGSQTPAMHLHMRLQPRATHQRWALPLPHRHIGVTRRL